MNSKAVVEYFLRHKLLVEPALLDSLKALEEEQLKALIARLTGSGSTVVLDSAALGELEPDLRVIENWTSRPSPKEVGQFVSQLSHRYQTLASILAKRPELAGALSIRRALASQPGSELAIIGVISEKRETKSGGIMLVLEDPSGRMNVFVNKNKAALFGLAKDTVLDEVVGVTGKSGERILFANNIILPDLPSRELTRAAKPGIALFLSDFHFGSRNFLKTEFDRFLDWLNNGLGDPAQRALAESVRYIFIIGDVVDGIGVYPNQQCDLEIVDLEEQYDHLSRALSKIPRHIKIIISPGNHDGVRLAEPQPSLEIPTLTRLQNVLTVSNPALLSVGATGLTVLLYHGLSFLHYAYAVESIRLSGGPTRPELIARFLLQRRHLAPTYTSTLIAPSEIDALCISQPPDIFASGHLHRASVANYKSTTMLNCSCWLSKTDYQLRLGLEPEPARAIAVELSTRETRVLKF